MSAAQLMVELAALLDELESLDMTRVERAKITARIERMMPEHSEEGAALAI
ncbi:hypothetical protein [Aeromonas veronii]|uniref:hypothetical protein n=1 Tax=Aeromonas veronii TaxID=654 RepID=UPI002247A806|nr:hypothetical protein [Aeromonas veronii]MCX0443402.1 hypothetical protein [Aeromonas veronii]